MANSILSPFSLTSATQVILKQIPDIIIASVNISVWNAQKTGKGNSEGELLPFQPSEAHVRCFTYRTVRKEMSGFLLLPQPQKDPSKASALPAESSPTTCKYEERRPRTPDPGVWNSVHIDSLGYCYDAPGGSGSGQGRGSGISLLASIFSNNNSDGDAFQTALEETVNLNFYS